VSESCLRKTSKNSEISIPNYRTANGVELQSTAETACRDLSCCPGLFPNSSSFYFPTFPEISLSLLPLVTDPRSPQLRPGHHM
jgi:hypothetical protein